MMGFRFSRESGARSRCSPPQQPWLRGAAGDEAIQLLLKEHWIASLRSQ
jgi:hypothetical protein